MILFSIAIFTIIVSLYAGITVCMTSYLYYETLKESSTSAVKDVIEARKQWHSNTVAWTLVIAISSFYMVKGLLNLT